VWLRIYGADDAESRASRRHHTCGTPRSAVCGGRRPGGNNGNGPIISALRYPRSTSEVVAVLWSATAMRGFQNGLSRDFSQQPRRKRASDAVRFVPRSR
jgi:hypothetical protein